MSEEIIEKKLDVARLAGITCAATMFLLIAFVKISYRMLESGGKHWDEATVTVTDYAVHITFTDS
jgi:hypothetical protein